ncbi:pentatricopeptide repeat-containing protein At4g13650 [Phalaenopsis equestris]|uniref:pentatricopeptide repeat-containing protein At4g13650 n=1 Tax=Phalaenopsis equestris TaxID=78828 RepID=UPI0009E39260|nr:pentatricopeptide repeat-containing protein At4g13650 [Phalaenopsis equestris]
MVVTASSVRERLIRHAARPRNPSKTAPRRPKNPPPSSSILHHIVAGDLRTSITILRATPSPFPASVYSRLLHLCASRQALVAARCVESHIISSSYPSPPSTFLLNRSIETYALCGSIADARELFDEMPHRSGGTWNAMISAYACAGCPSDAIALFVRMNGTGIRPKDVTFASVLGSCSCLLALTLAKQLHGLILKFGFCVNVILGTSLVDVYGKCRIMDEAQKKFDEIPDPNPVSWNVIVRRYLDFGQGEKAVDMFLKMIHMGVIPLNFTISSALVACSDSSWLCVGCQIHGIVVKNGFLTDLIVENSVLEMYSKCGCIEDARWIFNCSVSRDVVSWTSMVSGYASCGQLNEAEKLFYEMPERNVVSWNALLAGYVQSFNWEKAFDFFQEMRSETKEIDFVTLGLMLNSCAGLLDSEKGKQIHGFAYRHLLYSDIFFSNALLDLYTKCGNLKSANHWFLQMCSRRDKVSWNSLLAGYAHHGRSEEAFDIFNEMLKETTPNEFTFSLMLAASANIFMLENGKQMHAFMIRNEFNMDVILRGALVDMYCKCRLINYAIRVFKEERLRDVVLWNSVILGLAYNGRGDYSFELFEAMKRDGIKPDNITFIGLLLACIGEGSVNLGFKYFYMMSEEYGVLPRIEHYECMIELLGKHGSMVELHELIQRMPFEPSIPMWSRIYDSSKHVYRRLREVNAVQVTGSNGLLWSLRIQKDIFNIFMLTYWPSARSALNYGVLDFMKSIPHSWEKINDEDEDDNLAFLTCNLKEVPATYRLLDSSQNQSLTSPLLRLDDGMAKSASAFRHLPFDLSLSNSTFFSNLLQSSIKAKSLLEVQRVHARLLKTRFASEVFIQNRLIDAYSKCGLLHDAQQVFEKMPDRNTFTWNNIIGALLSFQMVNEAELLFHSMPAPDQCSWNLMVSGAAQHGCLRKALQYFNGMHSENFVLNGYSFSSALSACAGLFESEFGLQIHAMISKSPFAFDVYMGSALVDMYSKCRQSSDAHRVFDYMPEKNIVSWNSLITCYEQNGPVSEAMDMFVRMMECDVEYDEVTLASVVSACASLFYIREGKQIHTRVIKFEKLRNDLILSNALVDMYAKCGKVGAARKIFDRMIVKSMVSETTMLAGYVKSSMVDDARLMFVKMPEKNIVAWNALIAGYTQNGENEEAFRLFLMLKRESVWPSHYTFGNVLNACANLAVLQIGQQAHAHVLKHGFRFENGPEPDIFIGNSLLDMYHKCGSMDEARTVFERMLKRDKVSWNAMIVGYAQNGSGEEAINLYARMLMADEAPDHVTMIGVLSGCSHAGLLEEGRKYFDSMVKEHGLIPSRDHYTCMIDLLGRAGRFSEVEKFMREMPIVPDSVLWSSLLSACRVHRNVEMGEWVAGKLFELDSENSGPYILLSNMYAEIGRWADVVRIRRLMKDRGVIKQPGCSWVEIGRKIHVFTVKDKTHSKRKEIHRILRVLKIQMERLAVESSAEVSLDILVLGDE